MATATANNGAGIGARVTYRDLAGCSGTGRIVATEQVGRGDLLGRSPGTWATIRLDGTLFEDISIPADRIGAVLDVTG